MKREILYIASGRRYTNRMLISAESVKKYMSEIHITAITDQEVSSSVIDDNVVYNDFNNNNGDSIIRPQFVNADRTLFLDVDTHLTQDISDLFSILDKYDIAASHNPERIPEWFEDNSMYKAEGVPEAFPQYNTGVLLFKNNEAVLELFSEWWDIYRERVSGGFMFNQPAFREALYKSDVRLATLPPEYNVRLNRPGYLNGPAKILHGWHPEIRKVESSLNSTIKPRVFTLKKWPIQVMEYDKGIQYEIIESLKTNGLSYTLKAGVGRISKFLSSSD